jgi:hypothetical protein
MGQTSAWVELLDGVVFVHIDRCAALCEGLVQGDHVVVDGQGYKGQGVVATRGWTESGRLRYHVMGAMHQLQAGGQNDGPGRFVVVLHGWAECIGTPAQRTEVQQLRIRVQSWVMADGADVSWTSVA